MPRRGSELNDFFNGSPIFRIDFFPFFDDLGWVLINAKRSVFLGDKKCRS